MGGVKIQMGSDCLLSNGVGIYSTDFHTIYSYEDRSIIINKNKNVIIGNHVWIGIGSQILKGSRIADDSVVGASSLVSGQFELSNIVIAGNPARCCKDNIIWKSDSINE